MGICQVEKIQKLWKPRKRLSLSTHGVRFTFTKSTRTGSISWLFEFPKEDERGYCNKLREQQVKLKGYEKIYMSR
jgi:hypothetical protein